MLRAFLLTPWLIGIVGAFLLIPWHIGIKYSKYITLCDTNTVISNITNKNNCNWHIVSTYLQKSLIWITKPKKRDKRNSKIFKLRNGSNYAGWAPRFPVISHIILSITLGREQSFYSYEALIKIIWENQVLKRFLWKSYIC